MASNVYVNMDITVSSWITQNIHNYDAMGHIDFLDSILVLTPSVLNVCMKQSSPFL